MNIKKINNNQFKDAIRVAFDKDVNIYSLYCPHIKVDNVEDIVDDISGRIGKDESSANLCGIYEKGKLIGYYVYRDRMLISFGLNIQYRTRKYLREFYSTIKKDLGGHFTAFLWSRNIRAIKWLVKMGMGVVERNDLVTQLITD